MTLFEAVEAGDLPACRTALTGGCNVNARFSAGVTALHLAAAHGDADLVRVLLDAGADPNLPSHRPVPEPAGIAPGVAVAELSARAGVATLGKLFATIFGQSVGPRPAFEGHTPLTEAAVG